MEQQRQPSLDFFLGATTPAGFKGYFPQLAQEKDRQLYLIKSGPGCGKSTLMKTLAQRASGPVQRIHCASDPDSLDGVVFAQPCAAVLDATPPHSLEPTAPGADEVVVSLYHTLDAPALHVHQEETPAAAGPQPGFAGAGVPVRCFCWQPLAGQPPGRSLLCQL